MICLKCLKCNDASVVPLEVNVLFHFYRNQKTDVSSKRPSTLPAEPLTTCTDSQSFARNEGHSIMGKDVKEEQNRLRGFEVSCTASKNIC